MKIKPINDPDKKDLLKSLFDQYFTVLVSNASKYVKSLDEAEEIVQDVFVKVWYELEGLSGETDFKAYLYRSVYNSCMNFLKHQKVQEKFRYLSQNEFKDYNNEISSEYEKDEVIQTVDRAINLLPEKWREVFLMSRFDELKYHEIATKLGISQKTVEKYITKSLSFLRTRLKDFIPFIIIFNNL